jgi:hypothetical protein
MVSIWVYEGEGLTTKACTFIEKKYNLAEDHLLMGTDHSAELIGKLAYNWASDENVQWKGVYLARIVLQ